MARKRERLANEHVAEFVRSIDGHHEDLSAMVSQLDAGLAEPPTMDQLWTLTLFQRDLAALVAGLTLAAKQAEEKTALERELRRGTP